MYPPAADRNCPPRPAACTVSACTTFAVLPPANQTPAVAAPRCATFADQSQLVSIWVTGICQRIAGAVHAIEAAESGP